MATRDLPDMYTLSPWACDHWASGVHIRYTTRAHVTNTNVSLLYHYATVRNISCSDEALVSLLREMSYDVTT